MAVIYNDWHEVLPFALPYMGIMLSVHVSAGATPLHPSVYDMKAMLPMEVEVSSTGVLPKSKFD